MKYFDLFDSIESLNSQWGADLKDEEVLIAVYSNEDYSGSAFVVFKRDGVLYEAHDGHCSCHGLDVWEPEETSWAALAMRDYHSYGSEFDAAYKALVSSHA